MSDYELTAGDEPVSVAVDQDIVHVTLGPLVVSYQTHRDQDPWDEREELLGALSAVQASVVEAVDRQKFIHSVHHMMAVLYAKHRGIGINHAWNTLLPQHSEAYLRSVDEWSDHKGREREKARDLLQDVLTEHGWSLRGGVVGAPPQRKARLVDLETGELIETQANSLDLGQGLTAWAWEWRDINGGLVELDRPGQWWRLVGAVRELPQDPWMAELEQILGPRKE